MDFSLFDDDVEQGKHVPMEFYGNKGTFNMEAVLKEQITQFSLYYMSLPPNLPFSRIIDEIYNGVDHVEPWMSGNVRGASTAFCLLHRLFEMGLNEKQVRAMLDTELSPFVRAVGFLYLRFSLNPRNIWDWIKGYVDDEEEFEPSPFGGKVTMGAYVRDVFLDMYYFETILPRVPQHIVKQIKDELTKLGLPSEPKGNAGTGGRTRREDNAGAGRPQSVKSAMSMKVGGISMTRKHARRDEGDRDRGGDKDRERDGNKGRDRDTMPPPADRPRRSDAGWERERDRDRAGPGARDRSRSRERDWGRDGGREGRGPGDGHDRERGGAWGRGGGGEGDRARAGRGGGPRDGRDRGDWRGGGPGRDRERERGRERDEDRGGRSAADAFRAAPHSKFRESAPGSLGNRTLSDTYGDASGKVALGVVRGRDATAGSVEAYRLGMKNPYKH